MTTLMEAARERAQQTAQRADRPRQRRAQRDTSGGGWPHVTARARVSLAPARRDLGDPQDPAEPVEDGGPLHFTGHASVYEQPYEMWDWCGPYMEVVSAGAGAVSLARADLDVPLVLGHDQLRRMARTTNGTLILAEDDAGLSVDAPGLDPCDADVCYIAPKLRAGLIDEMSFAFRIVRGMWSPDYTEYRIVEYDIHRGDVAIVGYGANPYTDSGVRSAPAGRAADQRARALLELAIAR